MSCPKESQSAGSDADDGGLHLVVCLLSRLDQFVGKECEVCGRGEEPAGSPNI